MGKLLVLCQPSSTLNLKHTAKTYTKRREEYLGGPVISNERSGGSAVQTVCDQVVMTEEYALRLP